MGKAGYGNMIALTSVKGGKKGEKKRVISSKIAFLSNFRLCGMKGLREGGLEFPEVDKILVLCTHK